MPTDPAPAVATVDENKLLSPSAAAEYLAERGLELTDQTLRRWADLRRVRHIALPSGLVKFRREDLDELLNPVDPAEPEQVA